MSLGAILGQMLQQGMAGPAQSRMRQGAGAAGGGVEQILGALLSGAQGGMSGGAAPGAGGMGGLLGAVLGGAQGGVPGATRPGATGPGATGFGATGIGAAAQQGGQSAAMGGGMGDLLGAMLGGRAGGAQRPAAGGGAGGIGDMLGAMLGAGGAQRGGAASAAQGGGMGDLLGAMLGGGADGAQRPAAGGGAGGIGDMLGAMLGGQAGGGAGGGAAMAVLGGLALNALRGFAAQQGAAAPAIAPQDAQTLVDDEAEALALRAMIAAMKADGRLDQAEVETLRRTIAEGGITDAELAFVQAELEKPLDIAALAQAARGPLAAAQTYAASIVAIAIDTDAERAYLRALAQALGLDAATVARLHEMTGAPAV